MKNEQKKLVTSSKVLIINPICMKCNGEHFTSNSKKRQSEVKSQFGSIPSDCVDSSIDGHKCPFITGKAFVQKNHIQHIS